jgi:hypothetical protein
LTGAKRASVREPGEGAKKKHAAAKDLGGRVLKNDVKSDRDRSVSD